MNLQQHGATGLHRFPLQTHCAPTGHNGRQRRGGKKSANISQLLELVVGRMTLNEALERVSSIKIYWVALAISFLNSFFGAATSDA
jgi:hypothetical protein